MRNICWLSLVCASCAGSEPSESEEVSGGLCILQDAPWILHYERAAGSNPVCPDLPDQQIGTHAGTLSEDDCGSDNDCDCTIEPFSSPACEGSMHEVCVDSDVTTTIACTFHLTSPTVLSGGCEVDVDIAEPDMSIPCNYSFTVEPL